MNRILAIFLVLLIVVPVGLLPAQESLPTLSQQTGDLLEGQSIRGWKVTGLTDDDLAAIKRIDVDSDQGQKLIQLFVDTSDSALLGRVFLNDEILYFEPRFEPSMSGGRAVFQFQMIREDRKEPIVETRKTDDSHTVKQSSLTSVYPGHASLPQNVLRMYLQFSNPMRQGDSYRHIQFMDKSGDTIDSPYLEIAQELWSDDGTRLTLLFDPGRIKQGLDRHEELGPPFRIGETYTMVVSSDWSVQALHPSRRGTLREEFRHTFSIVEPDRIQPSVDRWQVTAPAVESNEALHVRFDEPLDFGMLQHSLQVYLSESEVPVPGEVKVSEDGREWHFVPEQHWKGGEYRVVANPRLEDRSGNSLAQPFERSMKDAADSAEAETSSTEVNTTLEFTISR